MQDDSIPEARNACVHMLFRSNVRPKLPIGYFVSDVLPESERQCNVVKETRRQCNTISRLAAIGGQVASLTFDGAVSNCTMAKCIGADLLLSIEHIVTSFMDLSDPCKLVL